MVVYFNNIMNILWILSAVFCVASCSILPTNDFEPHFERLQTIRHPFYNKGVAWQYAKSYIKNRFMRYGIVNVTTQSFSTQVATPTGKLEKVIGHNVIGIVNGKEKNAPIIIIGADVDTPLDGNPYKDNAGGISVLLETVKLFEDRILWNPYQLDKTVIFVAFDLNTKKYSQAANSKSGSYHFVHHWLPKFLLEQSATLNGAIILDSVTTYYTDPNTQRLPKGFRTTFPDAHRRIVTNGNKGNFLGFVRRKGHTENQVKKIFFKIFKNDTKIRDYRLQDLPLQGSWEILTKDLAQFIDRQAQYHFWTYHKLKLPAFLLFDTGDSRNSPTDNSCTRGKCSPEVFLTEERKDLMAHIVRSLLGTLLELQTTKYDIPESRSESSPMIKTECTWHLLPFFFSVIFIF